MRKVLSILLIGIMTIMFFAGCNNETQNPSVDPTPTQNGGFGERPCYSNPVIEFNLYNEGDYTTRWNDVTKEWMLNNFKLKIAKSIPGIANVNIASEDGRKNYNTSIATLFISDDSAPDYMPALRGSSVGSDVCFKELGSDFLVDFNPYIADGGILQCYVDWVWGDESKLGLWSDASEYWESTKKALEVDGALYALPRRECMPIQNYLGYASVLLKQINVDISDLPTTWDGFVELLTIFKNYKNDAVPFTMFEGKASNLLAFVASTYGLDFNEDFSWTQKNGEPLWTYYWDEYLEILKDVKDLAAQGLVATDTSVGKKDVIINYDFDYTKAAYKKYKAKSDVDAGGGNSIAVYTTQTKMAIWGAPNDGGLTEWIVSDKTVAQEGKKASLHGTSQLDAQIYETGGYIAIGKRLGNEFALRIMDMLAYSASDEGYISYFFGKVGTPFADSVWDEKAGNIVYDENGKLRLWCEDRFGWAENKSFWVEKDSHAEALNDWDWDLSSTTGVNTNYASEYGITDTGFWPNVNNYKFGTFFMADVTSWPMKLTAYWERESMNVYGPLIDAQVSEVNKNGSMIYQGMYQTPVERLGATNGEKIRKKIVDLQIIAKNFTVDFLKGDKTVTDWDTYIKNLQDAGYDDVYIFYKNAAWGFSSNYNADVESQTYANEQKNK